MRLVILDTETTGLRVEEGHRVIEIGCVECLDRRVTERHFHVALNPERDIDEGATAVHGMTWDQLRDKPLFSEVVDSFLDFVRDATLVIHNAVFDCGFLDAELRRLGRPPLASQVLSIIDSLAQARDLHPGQRNSLDALCQRYGIRTDHRVLHGALLDARLLADAYLAMTRGQETLVMADESDAHRLEVDQPDLDRLMVLRASPDEVLAHEAVLAELDRTSAKTVWRQT